MIEQHYFTMVHKGIFNKNAGYATIASSRGLSEKYLSSTVQKYCQSDLDLVDSQTESSEFFIYSGIDKENLIVGRGILIDNGIKKGEIFIHNYVITDESSSYYLKHMEKIIYATDFKEGYEIESGDSLPRKEEIPYEENQNMFDTPGKLLAAIGLKGEDFIKLIECIFSAVQNDKNIKIFLEVDDSEFYTLSKGLLVYIYKVLPIKFRRKLGYVINPFSYKNMPGSNILFFKRNNSNIQALDCQTPNNQCIDEYSFVTENGQLVNNNFKYKENEFIKFTYKNLEKTEIISKILTIGDAVIKDDHFNLARYDKLVYFYNALSFLELASPKMVEDNAFINEAQEKIMSLIRKDEDKYSTSDTIYAFLDYFVKEYPIEEYKGRYGFVSDVLKYNLYKYIFNTLDLSTVNRDNILKIHLREEEEDDEKYLIINTVQHIITASEFEVDKLGVFISKLSKEVLYNINILVKDYYEINISRENYPFIILGFVSGADKDDSLIYNFTALLDYFNKIGGQAAIVEIIKYIADDFKEIKNRRIYVSFVDAVRKLIIMKERDIFKYREANIVLFSIKNREFIGTLSLIKSELSSGIKKLIFLLKRKIT